MYRVLFKISKGQANWLIFSVEKTKADAEKAAKEIERLGFIAKIIVH